MNDETELLLRYLDGELSRAEADDFRARLAESPELRRRLASLQQVGSLVRSWAGSAAKRADGLLESTLERVEQAERRRSRRAALSYVLVAVLIMGLPWARRAPDLVHESTPNAAPPAGGAAIERLESGEQRAQVFVLGSSSTPVVWLADEAQDEDEQGPG